MKSPLLPWSRAASLLFVPLLTVGVGGACSANVDVFGTGGDGGATTAGPVTVAQGTTAPSGPMTSGPVTNGPGVTATATATSSTGMGCPSGPDDDVDMDGFTPNDGDCNDCDAGSSPNNLEIPGNAQDEDCDGALDNVLEPCDAGLALADADPLHAANAIELCKASTAVNDWGVVSAAWVLADGTPPPADPGQLAQFHLGHGLLDNFGNVIVPREGLKMLALSNAVARDAADPDYADPDNAAGKGYTSGFPAGGPKSSVECPGSVANSAHDPIALEVAIRAPGNATGFSFDSNFFSADWPGFVCSAFDDTFFAHLSPTPAGLPDGLFAFYPNGNPVSLNGAPFDVCSCMAPPCMGGGKTYACAQGDAALAGTGFETHAATGWQVTQVPVPPGGAVTLRLGVYDGSDPILGASALVDAFTWITAPNVMTQTVASP